MDFIDTIKQFSTRVEKVKGTLVTEEATKMSLIVPFFQLLGYDVFNPSEFVPEYTADFGVKKGEKVDYAIFLDGIPVILIEAKGCNESLDNHTAQLFRYFSTTKARFGILTNGVVYRFFTDLENANLMDDVPFLEFDLSNPKDAIINEVKKFHKTSFDVDNIFSTASELKYSNEFRSAFAKELQSPSDEVVKLFLQNTYSGMKTQAVIERFRPILKQALNDYISEMMQDKIKSALASSSKEDIQDAPPLEAQEAPKVPESKIVTTPEELESYFIVKNLLRDVVDIKDVLYVDTERYFAINYTTNKRNWICRLEYFKSKKTLIIPGTDKKEQKYVLEDIYDITKYGDLLIESVKRFL